MFDLEKYTRIMRVLEDEIKGLDIVTAHNIAKEISVIYLKYTYAIPQPGILGRLDSLIVYINKTLPNAENLVLEIADIRQQFSRLLS